MKVEIITLHNVKNYGSVLQTYVTQQVLKELGYDSEVIDYYREDLIEKNILQNRLNSSSIFSKNIITRMIGRIFIKKDIKNQSKKFNKFISQYLKITPKSYYSNEELKEDLPKADIYCTGSDQVWNGEWNNGIEKAFFLDFVPDDMPKILDTIMDSDMIVFATPIYYFGFSAQIKSAIDRFYSRNGQIQIKHLKSAFIATAWNNDNQVMQAIEKHIEILIDYLNLDNQGTILAKGYGYTGASSEKHHKEEAYNLGKKI